MKSFPYSHNPQGLSLVEILVVLGLFSGIATLSLATLFNTQAINTRLLQSQAILDNVNLSLQTITREIRYGTDFYCAQTLPEIVPTLRKGCPNGSGGGGAVIVFRPAESEDERDRVTYFVSNGILYKRETFFGQATTTYQMTSQDIYITRLKVFIQGANSSSPLPNEGGVMDDAQPLISLFISGRARSSNSTETPVPFYIQTQVSTRALDNS